MATTQDVDQLVRRARWELTRYATLKPPDQRSVRARLLNMAGDLEAKRDKKHKSLNAMWEFMADDERWDALGPGLQEQRYQQFRRTIHVYEQLSDCVREIAALR
mgnify:CR=1 FL=1